MMRTDRINIVSLRGANSDACLPAGRQQSKSRIASSFDGFDKLTAGRLRICPEQAKARRRAAQKALAMTRLVIMFITLFYFSLPQVYADDWPQVAKDPQHTGYSQEVLGTNFQVDWTYPFQPERIFPQTQAIVYDGKIYVGTENNNMYALYAGSKAQNANAGTLAWKFTADGPIMNSVAADNGKVYFGTLAGSVYAINTSDGTLAWRNQIMQRKGFSTAPVIGDNKVLLGGRDGYFYALNPSDGQVIWKYNTGTPILQTAAYNNGKVFFGTMDMYVYALNTSPTDPENPNAILSWKSPKINGMAFNDYWPVVTQGRVIIRPMAAGYDWGLHSSDYSDAAQTQALANYDANPGNYNLDLIILDESTGQMTPSLQVIHWDNPTMDTSAPPPCVDRDGNIIVQAPREGSWQAGWARADLTTRKIVQPLYDGTTVPGNPNWYTGYGNSDENLNVSCSHNLILALHSLDWQNAQVHGYFNLGDNMWTQISTGIRNNEMGTWTETQGNNPGVISNGMVYKISLYQIIARTTQ